MVDVESVTVALTLAYFTNISTRDQKKIQHSWRLDKNVYNYLNDENIDQTYT